MKAICSSWFHRASWLPCVCLPAVLALACCAAESSPVDPAATSLGGAWADFVETNFPFFSSVLDARMTASVLATNNLTPRGLILNLGNSCWACFDTDLLRMSAVWTGQGVSAVSMSRISYHAYDTKAKEGEEILPQMTGAPWLVNGIYPGWQAGDRFSLTDPREPGPDKLEVGRGPLPSALGQFKAVRLVQGGVRLEYEAAGAPVRERVEAQLESGQPVIQRHFRLEKVPQPLWLIVGGKPVTGQEGLKIEFASNRVAGEAPVSGTRSGKSKRPVCGEGFPVKSTGRIPSRPRVRLTGKALAGVWTHRHLPDSPPPARWPQILTTTGQLSSSHDAYVVDNIPLQAL